MKVYKGTDKDMKCRGYQFELGKTYEEPTADLCHAGFHACEHPLDVLGYYAPGDGCRYFEAYLDNVTDQREDDTKRVGKKIKLSAEIGIPGLVKAAVEYTIERAHEEDGGHATGYQGAASATGTWGAASATGYQGAASATGTRGAASATGTRGAASATGDQGAASATGDRGAASATGTRGAASATGYQGAASATGYQGVASVSGSESIAIVTGCGGKAKGALDCWIVLTERADWDGNTSPIKSVASFKVDGVKIKPDTYYTLKNGKAVLAE